MESPGPLTRRGFMAAAAAAALATAAGRIHAAATQRPNILLLCADQMHGRAFGAMDPFFDTPAMDRLAREGVVFDHAYCTTPQCSASRSSLYTGLYPHQTGVAANLGALGPDGQPARALAPGFATAGSLLGAAGYHTGYFGKWHMGSVGHYQKHFDEADLDGEAHEGATARARTFLQGAAATGKPFACFVNYINPHDIYGYFRESTTTTVPKGVIVPHPPSWSETFRDKPACQEQFMREDQGKVIYGKPDSVWEGYRCYYREKCRLLDQEVGALLEVLDTLGLAENTLVLVTSDHGDMDTHHRLIVKGPFMYEQLINVPLIIRPPAGCNPAPGARHSGLVSLVDVLPTLCDFAGASPSKTEGLSLRPWITGNPKAAPHDAVYVEYFSKQQWANPIRTLRTNQYKYNRYQGHIDELYDLEKDPDEMANLAAVLAHQEIRKKLAVQLAEWMQAHGDQLFSTYRATDRNGKPLPPASDDGGDILSAPLSFSNS